ncbi:MAG: c-type cytochrome [Candidatus Hydrogenedentes bacterium]|nr:c-type cytochrome [Candidatus Hydrogenedentota bacterium]
MASVCRHAVFSGIVCVLAASCSAPKGDPGDLEAGRLAPEFMARQAEPILPLPPQNLPAGRVALGRRLFHEPALSGAQRRISCATCHPLERGGTAGDGGPGIAVGEHDYDIPTVFNSAGQFAYFWNGRTQSLEGVIQSKVRSENALDAEWSEALARLEGDASYQEDFRRAYPESGISESAVENALSTFLQSLVTPNADFDRFLNGESLPEPAREGYQLFKDLGCVRCHQGAGVGGNLYASFQSYLESRVPAKTSDLGRFNVTGNEAHRYQFKVPGLRNVAVTAPYFHDGSAETLDAAVELMARHQLGRELRAGEISRIVAFLESLTGWYDERLLGARREQATE